MVKQRDVSPEVMPYLDMNVSEYIKMIQSKNDVAGFLYYISKLDSKHTFSIPNKRSVDYELNKKQQSKSLELLVPEYDDNCKNFVRSSKTYANLPLKSKPLHNEIHVDTFIRLLVWGGDEFFSLFSFKGIKNPELYLRPSPVVNLSFTGWLLKKPISSYEIIFLLSHLFSSLEKENIIADDMTKIRDWLDVLSDPNLRGMLGVRNKFGRDQCDSATILSQYFSVEEINSWFAILRYLAVNSANEVKNFSIPEAVNMLNRLRYEHQAHEVAPFVRNGYPLEMIGMSIKNDIDLNLITSMMSA